MRSPLPAAFLLASLACAPASTRGLLRVELPAPEGGPGWAPERDLTAAVQGGAAADGLACQPGTGAELLHCAAASVGTQSRGVTLDLTRSGTGYALSIEQVFKIPGRESPVCAIERRMAERIGSSLGTAEVHVDTRSDCKSR